MKIRFAQVRLSLDKGSVQLLEDRVLQSYPKAPVPVVMMRTGMSSSLANASSFSCRLGIGQSPSIW
jgi:hypothetical protein